MKLRAAFADETDAAKRKELAVAMQVRVSENPTHAFPGQWYSPAAVRKNITGNLEIAGDDLLEHREEICRPEPRQAFSLASGEVARSTARRS